MEKTVIEVEEKKIVSKAGETAVTVTPEGITVKFEDEGECVAIKDAVIGTAVTTNKSVEGAKINISPENIFGEEIVSEINKLVPTAKNNKEDWSDTPVIVTRKEFNQLSEKVSQILAKIEAGDLTTKFELELGETSKRLSGDIDKRLKDSLKGEDKSE